MYPEAAGRDLYEEVEAEGVSKRRTTAGAKLNSITLPSYITTNPPLVASLLASSLILTLFAIRFAHLALASNPNPHSRYNVL